jgi:N6-adenosine-specific RNA methylase IME4
MVLAIRPVDRGALMRSVLSFRPNPTLEASFLVGPFRAAFAEYWEAQFGNPVPVAELREILDPPVPIGTVLEFSKLAIPRDAAELDSFLAGLLRHLCEQVRKLVASKQRYLFNGAHQQPLGNGKPRPAGRTVRSLKELVHQGRKFPTIYADPPWAYENEASRAAAVKHYPTMSVDEICAEPLQELAEKDSHLHLWTPNGFLREAFDVIDSWGFEFKSCLVWVKNELGMGNSWRVSHEFLLLGVRGGLTFRDRTLPSWIQASRTIHSRKPGVIRALIERVSPGPYLELYGREELPDSDWTVWEQVEPRLF